jgi:hypothetical protein
MQVHALRLTQAHTHDTHSLTHVFIAPKRTNATTSNPQPPAGAAGAGGAPPRGGGGGAPLSPLTIVKHKNRINT